MEPRLLLGEEHGQCKDALIKLVTFKDVVENPEVKTDSDAI